MPAPRTRRLTHKTALWCACAALAAPSLRAQVDESAVPTYVDVAERGIRSRIDLGGRYTAVGNPNPPIRLDIDDGVAERDDLDVGGSVIFGWDRPFGVPVVGDLMADGVFDTAADSELSPFRDQNSAAPRARLYSAFVGFSAAPGELLEPVKLNVGRMTELVESPITYDGASAGVAFRFTRLGHVNAKVWGGLDAPQFIVDDPFTRTSKRATSETYVDTSGLISPTGAITTQRAPIEDSILNPVGGFTTDGRLMGIGWVLSHTLLPNVQRSRIGAGYQLDVDFLLLDVFADLKASDFLPRRASVRGDMLTWDGTTRVGANVALQFLEDVCIYDCTFRAFNPATAFVRADADLIETFRVRDQLRHLNMGPEQEHFLAVLEAERELPLGFSALLRGRLKQYLDAADLDYFRANVYEGGAGVSWSGGFSLEVGNEIVLGLLDTGTQLPAGFDQLSEGVKSYVENRTFVRNVLWEGKLSHLAEVFVRRQDVQSRAILAEGQWSGGLASTVRYDILDFWAVSMRVDADALSPVDSLNGSGYLGALLGTTLKF